MLHTTKNTPGLAGTCDVGSGSAEGVLVDRKCSGLRIDIVARETSTQGRVFPPFAPTTSHSALPTLRNATCGGRSRTSSPRAPQHRSLHLMYSDRILSFCKSVSLAQCRVGSPHARSCGAASRELSLGAIWLTATITAPVSVCTRQQFYFWVKNGENPCW